MARRNPEFHAFRRFSLVDQNLVVMLTERLHQTLRLQVAFAGFPEIIVSEQGLRNGLPVDDQLLLVVDDVIAG